MPRNWESIDVFEAFLNTGGIVESDDGMLDEYRRAVFRFIEQHANSELMAAVNQGEWVPRAPGLRHKIDALAKAQDALGHAHLLYSVAAGMGLKTRNQMLEDLFAGRTGFQNVFHRRAKTWTDLITMGFLVEPAALICRQAVFKSCSYGPYKRALKRIVAEEEEHQRFAAVRFRQIVDGTSDQRARFQRSIDDWWWPALRLFGPDNEPDDLLLRWHIKSERNEDLRDRWVQHTAAMLHLNGFSVPDPELRYDEEAERWIIGAIDWTPLEHIRFNDGPDSARKLGAASGNWQRTAWVRRAMDRPAALVDGANGAPTGVSNGVKV